MTTQMQERRSTAEAVNTPLRLLPVSRPTSDATENDSRAMQHTEEPQPAPIDAIAIVTMMCEMRRIQGEITRLVCEVADLRRQIRDINYREAV